MAGELSLLHGQKNEEKYEEKSGNKNKGNGIGLNNVIERLRLYFDGKNNVDIISSGKDQGTEVIITIPYKE
jgi:sensor histidine kinase YesM